MLKTLLLLCSLFTMIFFIPGCSSVSKTPSESEINSMALTAYNDVKAKSKISTNADWTRMVNRVAGRIANASGENFKWEWVLIESPEVNAWCMPGGKIAVYTGIMPVLKNEAALAAVLGHEVAHATKRHGMQRYARAAKENMLGTIIGGATVIGGQMLCKTASCKLLTGLGGAAAGFAITFFEMKYSRGDETEADKVGQVYMAKAGYEPSEAIKLWERMNAASKGSPPEWMSTHPSDVNRREKLQSWLPDVEPLYSQAPEHYGLGEEIH